MIRIENIGVIELVGEAMVAGLGTKDEAIMGVVK